MSLVAKAPKTPSASGSKAVPVAYPSSPSQITEDVPVARQATPTRRRKTKEVPIPEPISIVAQEKPRGRKKPPAEPIVEVPANAENVDTLLKDKKYKVVSRLMGKPSETAPKGTGHLVEVENKNGQKAFVELGPSHAMSVSSNDILLHETEEKMPIDVSEKNGQLSSLGMDISGLAFVCTKGICTLIRSEGPTEQLNYVYDGLSGDDDTDGSTLSIAYPVIRLADIMEDPDTVLRQTDRAIEQLRKGEVLRQKSEQERLKLALDNVKVNFSRFSDSYDKALSDLKESMKCLKIIEQDPDHDESDIHYNMRNRYRLLDELVSIGQVINGQIVEIENLSKRLDHLCKDINGKFANVGYMLKS